MNRIAPLFALIIAVALAGCGKPNPLGPDDHRNGGSRDTIIVVTPPDTCPHYPPCPRDTTVTPPPPPGVVATYATKAVRIHEAQSHKTIATITITSRTDSVRFVYPVGYETGNAQNNERHHLYLRLTTNFDQKYDATFPGTGTEVVPDPQSTEDWVTRTLLIGNLPPGIYEAVVQQDLPNHHSPGESDIDIGAGTATVFRR